MTLTFQRSPVGQLTVSASCNPVLVANVIATTCKQEKTIPPGSSIIYRLDTTLYCLDPPPLSASPTCHSVCRPHPRTSPVPFSVPSHVPWPVPSNDITCPARLSSPL